MTKAMKGRGVIKILGKLLPRHSLLTIYIYIYIYIYISFVRPQLGYGDILYDQPRNKSFWQKIETIQYSAALVITAAIKGISQIKIYNELGLESLVLRQWFRKLGLFFKIKKTGLPEHLFNMMPRSNHHYNTWSIEDAATDYFIQINT